jgi:hypothetical protein
MAQEGGKADQVLCRVGVCSAPNSVNQGPKSTSRKRTQPAPVLAADTGDFLSIYFRAGCTGLRRSAQAKSWPIPDEPLLNRHLKQRT